MSRALDEALIERLQPRLDGAGRILNIPSGSGHLSQQLEEANISPKQISNSSQLVLLEEQRQHWRDPAFWGYDRKLADVVCSHFKDNNHRFASMAWGTSWQEQFPSDDDALSRQRSHYEPPSHSEEERMHRICQRMLREIQSQVKRRS